MMKIKLYWLLCLILCALSTFYLFSIAKDRYISRAQFSIIVNDSTTADASTGLLSILSGGQAGSSPETQSTVGFIQSADLLFQLEEDFNLTEHYKAPKEDFIFKMEDDASTEDRLEYYRNRIIAQVNSASGLIDLSVECFDPETSYAMSQKILQSTEQFINSLNKKVANERLSFVKEELNRAQNNVEAQEAKILEFQNKHRIIQPEVIIAARLEAIQGLKIEKINKEIKLSTIKASSNNSPLIPELTIAVDKLGNEIAIQEERLSGDNQQKLNSVLAEYKSLENGLGFALKLREGAQIQLEQTRAEGISKSRFFSLIQKPFLPEEYTNPRRIYWSITVSVCIVLIFYLIRAIGSSIFDRA